MSLLSAETVVQSSAVTIIGGGIAGCEASWQLASRGVPVHLVEMRPNAAAAAHHTDLLGELVCSNSLKSDDPATAAGLLKRELESLGSLVMRCARATSVPAGGALAVDRTAFSTALTEAITSHPLIVVERREATAVPETGDSIVASGPLTSPALHEALSTLLGASRLHFFDAAAPIVDADTIDRTLIFAQSRYDKGESADYLNCPMDEAEYARFIDALRTADRVHAHDFETKELFQACQPVEEIARTGRDALRFGALKPVGLTDPRTGARPWAVVQLRPENRSGTAYNLVGFQTNLTFAEQRRVFSLIPGLKKAMFLRHGVMHRNTFIDAPRLLTSGLALRSAPRIHLAGQITGTEGYLEAAATGLVAALDIVRGRIEAPPLHLAPETVLGALLAYATNPATTHYQPMHVNFGLLEPLSTRVKGKRDRYAAYAARALDALRSSVEGRDDLGLPCATPWELTS